MRYLFQAICFYFQGLFKKIYLYLTLVILGTLGIIPLQAKSKSKGNLLSIAHHQETVPRQTKRKPKYMVKPGKRKSSQQDVFVKEQMNELFRSTIQLFVSTGLIFGLHQLCSKPFDLSTLVAPLIGNLAADPLEAIGRSSAMLFFPFLSKPRLNQAIDLKRQYAARKHTFSATMQSFIEQTLNRHIWAIQRFDYCNDKYVEVIQEVLQFPIGPKQIVPNTVVINQFMRNYPEAVRLAIGAFVATIVEDAKSSLLTKKATPIMFVGPPGTGKTYLAKQLASLLQLPVQCMDISRYKRVHGTGFDSSNPEKGVIAEALIGASSQAQNWSNKILVLDEIDKALAMDNNGKFVASNGSDIYNLLHTLLEAQEVAVPLSRYDHACPDISQLKIVLIANKTFTETLTADKAAALESRIKVIHFDEGFTPARKCAIATTYVDELLTKKGIDRSQFDQNVIDAIVAEDSRIGLKGVRVLLNVIDQYIDLLKYQKLIHEISGIQTTTFDVKQAYAPYHLQAGPCADLNDTKLAPKKSVSK